MMTHFPDLEYDLHLDGCSDGYAGTPPKHLEVTYLQGYANGARTKINELLNQLDLLTTDRDRYEQIYSTEPEF